MRATVVINEAGTCLSKVNSSISNLAGMRKMLLHGLSN